MNRGRFNPIKKKRENDDKNCFIFVAYLQHTTKQAIMTLGATRDMQNEGIWLTGVIRVR